MVKLEAKNKASELWSFYKTRYFMYIFFVLYVDIHVIKRLNGALGFDVGFFYL